MALLLLHTVVVETVFVPEFASFVHLSHSKTVDVHTHVDSLAVVLPLLQ